jgi:hypothetical protein
MIVVRRKLFPAKPGFSIYSIAAPAGITQSDCEYFSCSPGRLRPRHGRKREKPMTMLNLMRRQLVRALFAIIACYGLAVSAVRSEARAQDATRLCSSDCLLTQIDALDKRLDTLQRAVDALASESNKSIKSGQKIILHTDPGIAGGGCLTYIGPCGDLGGFVSWNVNCSHGTSWVIK